MSLRYRDKIIDLMELLLNTLCKEGFLISDTPKSAVRIGFPLKAIDRIFPSLYPSQACL